MEITIKIKDHQYVMTILRALEKMSLLEIKKVPSQKKGKNFDQVFGLWKGREINLKKIRESAWRI